MEYVLILLVISAAAAAINTTYDSTEKLIDKLAHNIRDTNVLSNASYVPPNAFIENTWGVTPLAGSPLIKGENSDGLTTGSSAIYDPSADNLIPPEERELTGKHLPVAYFTANQPSTFDILTVYDYSYDFDTNSDVNLKKFWKIEKNRTLGELSTVTGRDYNDDPSIKCSHIDSCAETLNEGREMTVWDTKGFSSGTFTQFTDRDMGGKNNLTYANERDRELFADGYCYGSAQQCIPAHLSNGEYTIYLIVMDADNNETPIYKQTVVIESRTTKIAYKYEYGPAEIISKTEIESDKPEERLLVDHQYALVTDLYGVKHPVIEMNMIRKSTSKKYKITTRQEIKVIEYRVSIDTGEEIEGDGYPKVLYTYTQESTKEVYDTGTAGSESASGDDGNLWYTEKLNKNKWKFYIYDKRSLFNKRFITDVGAAIDTSIDQIANPTPSNGATYISISKGGDFANSDFNSLKGQSSPSSSETTWSEKENGLLNRVTTDQQEMELVNDTTQMHISQSHARYPYADKNSSMSAYADVEGYSNTLYPGTSTTVSKNKDAVTTGKDFSEHEDNASVAAAGYVRTCIKNCGNQIFKKMDSVPDVSIVQLESNYALLDDETGTTVLQISEPFTDAKYRDTHDDFNDGSRMYQLRTDVSGSANGEPLVTDNDNDYDPEFISVRLSLNDFYGYNPGANLDTIGSIKTADLEENFKAQLKEDALLAETYPTNYNYGAHKSVGNTLMGCNECTEPNFNTDGKMQWTEYRLVEGTANPGGSYSYSGTCTARSSYPSVNISKFMDARTRQYNWVEHTAFDWVYEYSGEGDSSAQKATNGTAGNRTIKIRRSHWHTAGRSLEEITMGTYADPYITATNNNQPYGAAPDSTSTAVKNIRFLKKNNNKSPLTASDTEDTGSGGSDGSGREAFWKTLKGSAEQTEKDTDVCEGDRGGCSCGGSYPCTVTAWTKTTLSISYTGLGEEVITVSTNEGGSERCRNRCEKCPPPADSGG